MKLKGWRSKRTFSLRGLLLVVAFVAIGLAVFPPFYRRLKWRDDRIRLIDWSKNVKRTPNKCETFTIRASNGQWLTASTAFQEVGQDFDQATYDGAMPDPKRFFVIPPGKWVDTIDQILDTWEEFD